MKLHDNIRDAVESGALRLPMDEYVGLQLIQRGDELLSLSHEDAPGGGTRLVLRFRRSAVRGSPVVDWLHARGFAISTQADAVVAAKNYASVRRNPSVIGGKFARCVAKLTPKHGARAARAICASTLNRAYPGALAAAQRAARKAKPKRKAAPKRRIASKRSSLSAADRRHIETHIKLLKARLTWPAQQVPPKWTDKVFGRTAAQRARMVKTAAKNRKAINEKIARLKRMLAGRG